MLVFVAAGKDTKTHKLPSMWMMGAYRSLPRPFKKNVQLIVLVRPGGRREIPVGLQS